MVRLFPALNVLGPVIALFGATMFVPLLVSEHDQLDRGVTPVESIVFA